MAHRQLTSLKIRSRRDDHSSKLQPGTLNELQTASQVEGSLSSPVSTIYIISLGRKRPCKSIKFRGTLESCENVLPES